MLAETAESLASTARELKRTTKTFEKIAASVAIPKHYLTERGILYFRKELDEWLIER